jgi:branched-chain amino acid transport system substrate-binding protein
VIAKAGSDPEFKARLMSDPHAALKEMRFNPSTERPSRIVLRTFLLLIPIAVSLVVQGCSPVGSRDKPAPLVLGAIYNLSGTQAGLDIPSSQGARLAVEEVNRDGGLLGRPVQLILEDGESEPAVIERKTADILERFPSTSALMGLSDTDMVLAAAPVAASSGRLFLTSGATSPRLPAQVPEYLFLACFGDNVQAAAGAEWAYQDLSARSVSILFDSSSSYTRLLQEYFQTRFEELGGQVLSVESYTADDLSQPISRLQESDLIFLSAMPEEALEAVRLLREAGFSAPILGGDGLDLADLWSKHPEVSNVFFTTHAYLGPDNPDPKVIAFREAYNQAYPGSTADAFAALGYDAARLLMAAIARAESTDPDAIRKGLAGIREFEGVTGTMSYPSGSRIPVKSVSILQIEGGNLKLARQFVPAQVPPP